jgi:glyoxylase-like metal-dependent hydrolase (beta-lactamase superfamily II)
VLIIEALTVGPLMENCYVVGCEETKEAVVIDPGDEAGRILDVLGQLQLTLIYIINTHGHFDHVGANKELKEATGADILIHPLDAQMLGNISASASSFGLSGDNSPPADKTIQEGDTVSFGTITFQIFDTPGHTPGGISLYTDQHVFVGDALFAGSIGRTDFPGGDYDTLISSIRQKLFTLPDDAKVYSGHGPVTTIGREKRFNPFAGLAAG